MKSKAVLAERVLTGAFSRLLLPLLLTCWLLVGLLLLHSYQSSVSNYGQSAYKRSEQHTLALLELQKSLVTAKLQEMQRILATISNLLDKTELSNQQLLQALQALKQPNPKVLALILLDKEGQLQAFSLQDESPDLADRDYFTWHRNNPDSGQLFLSKPLESRSEQKVSFVALSKARTSSDGDFQGILAMAIDLKALAYDLRGLVSEGGHATVLAHQEGEIYFRMPWVEDSPAGGISPVIAQHQGSLKSSHLTRITSPFDGKPRQLAYGRVGNWPLVAFISENLEDTEISVQAYQKEQAVRWGLAFLLASFLFAGLAQLILQRQKTLLQLSENEERYRLAKDAANLGIWDLRLTTGQLTWDSQTWQQLGYSKPAFNLNHQAWVDTIHPEDQPEVLAITSAKIQSNEPFEIEYRARTAQGSWQWIQGRGQTVAWDEQGSPLRVLGTSQVIQAQKDAEQKLQEQTAALKVSNEELEQFAYVASHDLRQPLRMISSYVELLKRRLKGQLDDETQVFMNFIAEGSARMDNMLVSLLEYSRVGRYGEPLANLDAKSLAREALTYLQPQIRETQAEIEMTGNWPDKLIASRNEIVRLFQNLINNALKYQPEGQQPKVTLSAQAAGDHWLFKVEDNGIGIEPEQQNRLFKVFQRLHTRQEYEGTGIGLAICRKIVDRHEGEIWVHSAGKGQGSCFCFTLAREQG